MGNHSMGNRSNRGRASTSRQKIDEEGCGSGFVDNQYTAISVLQTVATPVPWECQEILRGIEKYADLGFASGSICLVAASI
jgi:hypothetical protein